MALNIPGLKPLIDEAMKMHPTIFTKALPIQMEKLIIEPCMQLESLASSRWLIVVDGLDECVGAAGVDREQEQELVLNLLISLLSHSLPFFVLLCARAESWLKDEFNSDPLSGMTETLPLYASTDADEDMLRYLKTEFDRIASCQRNALAMRSVPRPWPPTSVPLLIVEKSSGQFVYAKTAIRFLDDRWNPPEKQLTKLLASLKRSGNDASIFSPLDALYTGILESCPNTESMLQVLGEVICFDYAAVCKDRWDILDTLFERTSGESFQALRGLHSLVDVENCAKKIKKPLFHTSFHEFLTTSSRAGAFFIDLPSVHARLLHRCMDHLERRDYASEHFRSGYDRSMVWSLDRFTDRGFLKRFFDACFLPDLPGVSVSAFKHETRGSPPDYIPILTFEGTPLTMLPLKGVDERLRSSVRVDPAADPGAKSALELDDVLEKSLFSPEFGSQFDVFSQPFLMFLADPARSLHHCYILQDRIRLLIRTMLVHPSGFPGILEASNGCETWDPIQLRYPFAQWFVDSSLSTIEESLFIFS
ncbi:hypothetical protein EST38_g11705 [Candolleomyces aberdarensis]|uniref:NACHT domain-containing protein n=1 Tax=Candolleomyces aberdarensis TaxID=2316362 RepID=A0A4Q2D7I4_9AGAR|nr:hypothetical protein EST38_g11705 [Candolleomyces aberdarensis]